MTFIYLLTVITYKDFYHSNLNSFCNTLLSEIRILAVPVIPQYNANSLAHYENSIRRYIAHI